MKKILRYILLILVISYLLFNPTSRKIFSRYIEQHQLSSNLELANQANLEYRKRLYYLETKPSQMERIVKSELDVIAEGEIEYRFNKVDNETNKNN